MKRILYILAIITLFKSCSKDDPIITSEEIVEEQINDGGVIEKLSLVKITNDNIIQEEYKGKIGSTEVLFAKTNDKELTFTVPNSIDEGENILEIPNLNGLKIKYEVKDITLKGTPEENIASYFTNIDDYLTTINNTPGFDNVNNYFKNLDDYFKNASEEEKIVMAKYYKANQVIFDSIINRDYLNKSAVDAEDIRILLRYTAAVLTCGVTTAFIILSPPDPVTKLIATGIAMIAFNFAQDLKRQFANKNIFTVNMVIDGLISELASKGTKKTELELYNDIEKSFSLQSQSRGLINSDVGNNNDNISKFFSSQSNYNSAIDKINTVIKFVNDNLFFSNIDLLEISGLEDSKPEITENANDLFFNNATFSIESSNVNIENISFKDGNLKVKVKIIDENIVTDFIATKLNYSYKDDFNEIQGSFPIKIYKKLELKLVRVSSYHQLGIGGQELSAPLIVKVLDSNDNSIENQKIKWEIITGNGAILLKETDSNSDGEVYNYWTIEDKTLHTGTSACGRISQRVKATLLDSDNKEIDNVEFIADKGFVNVKFEKNFSCSSWESGTVTFKIGDNTHTMNLNPNNCDSYNTSFDIAIPNLDDPFEGEISFSTSASSAYFAFTFYMEGGNISLNGDNLSNSTCSHMLFTNWLNWKDKTIKLTFSD